MSEDHISGIHKPSVLSEGSVNLVRSLCVWASESLLPWLDIKNEFLLKVRTLCFILCAINMYMYVLKLLPYPIHDPMLSFIAYSYIYCNGYWFSGFDLFPGNALWGLPNCLHLIANVSHKCGWKRCTREFQSKSHPCPCLAIFLVSVIM